MTSSYSQIIQKLYSLKLFSGMMLGLKNCEQLNQLLNYPDRNFSSIHVAGTNGKGSVTHKIATALQHAGYRVGQYTSPHISSFRERIRINQEMIPESDVQSLLSKIFEVIETDKIPATIFELTTFLALCYFAKENVDYAVLETGLGGRLDATNIISPKLSIITSISLDHTELLGHTVEEIAYEKAGIIKPNTPIITGPRVPFSVIDKVAQGMNSPHITVNERSNTFEEENRSIAKKALEWLSIPEESIKAGLSSSLPCRKQTILQEQLPLYHQKPFPKKLILDVAHNPDGLIHLFNAIRKEDPHVSIRVICGLSLTKDIHSCLAILKKYCNDFHLVEPRNGRGTPTKQLKTILLNLGLSEERISIDQGIAMSLEHAIQRASEQHEILVVCGTFFIMGEIRQALGIDEPSDELDMN